MEDRKLRMTNNEARAALKVALGDRAAAEAALAHARDVSDRGRAILAGVIAESERLDAIERRAAEVIEAQMRDALRLGNAPPATASDRDVSKNAAARTAIDVRRSASERVVSDFAASERDAAEAFQDAQAAVSAAVKAVVRAEAARLAARWAAVDAEALALRQRLGSPYGLLSNVAGLDADVLRAMTANADEGTVLQVNGAVEGAWQTLAAGLQSDPEARIDFSPVDQARAEAKAARERVFASDAEIQAQLAAFRSRPEPPGPAWVDLMADEAIA
jgi:hypothetical protein